MFDADRATVRPCPLTLSVDKRLLTLETTRGSAKPLSDFGSGEPIATDSKLSPHCLAARER